MIKSKNSMGQKQYVTGTKHIDKSMYCFIFMIVRTSAKSILISPGSVMRSEMPCTPCRRTSSAMKNASRIGVRFSRNLQEVLVGNGDQRVDFLAKPFNALFRELHLALALEVKRLGHHGNRQGAHLARHVRHRRGARATVPPPCRQ